MPDIPCDFPESLKVDSRFKKLHAVGGIDAAEAHIRLKLFDFFFKAALVVMYIAEKQGYFMLIHIITSNLE